MAPWTWLGCASKGESIPPTEPEDLVLALKLNKSVYRPGEAIIATVNLYNNSLRPLDIRALDGVDGDSVEFWYYLLKDPETTLKRLPVSSSLEEAGQTMHLEPGGSTSRRFLLTRFTEYHGSMAAQAHYEPNPPFQAQLQLPMVYSNVAHFDVDGQQLFERDKSGIILKKEAIGLAQAVAPGDVRGAEAVIIEDEKGFYKWWVNLRVRDGTGQDRLMSWLVDPYRGKVTSKARKPFPAQMARDDRILSPIKRKGTR